MQFFLMTTNVNVFKIILDPPSENCWMYAIVYRYMVLALLPFYACKE